MSHDEGLKNTSENIKNLDFGIEISKAKKDKEEENPLKNFQKIVGLAFDKKELAEQIIEIQPCYYDKARNWWLWNWPVRKWERVDETDILNAVERQAEINTINSKERNEMLEALKQVSRKNPPLEIKDTWIQFNKQIVDINTGEQLVSLPKYFVTNPIPWDLNEEKLFETPIMDKIFCEWVGEENVKQLYEILAYCLMPSYPIHRIFCLIGEGLNGKSKFLDLLRKFVGEDNVCSTELDTLINSRFEVTRLHKKLVCQMGETNFSEISKTSMIKKLSGGDLIGFEYKGKDHFQDKNYAKLIISTNNLPSTTDKTLGFYRRWMIIDFPNRFSEKKDILSEIPDEEYESLALKSTMILKDLLVNRCFTNEGTLDERKEKYEAKSNFLEQFVKEFVVEDYESHLTSADFYKRFSSWCKENRHREMSDHSVGSGMKKLGFESGRKYFDWMHDGRGGQLRCWLGVKWKE